MGTHSKRHTTSFTEPLPQPSPTERELDLLNFKITT